MKNKLKLFLVILFLSSCTVSYTPDTPYRYSEPFRYYYPYYYIYPTYPYRYYYPYHYKSTPKPSRPKHYGPRK